MDPLDVLAAHIARIDRELDEERRRTRVLEAALAHFARGQVADEPREIVPRWTIDDAGRSVRVKAVA